MSVLCTGCMKSSAHDGTSKSIALVQRLIAMDTSDVGSSDSASAMFTECDARTSDRLELVRWVRVIGADSLADTDRVFVQYSVLGYASSWDVSQVGRRNWRYVAKPQIELDTFLVVKPAGKPMLACGPHYGNHPGISSMGWYYERMDDASRRAWTAAVAASP